MSLSYPMPKVEANAIFSGFIKRNLLPRLFTLWSAMPRLAALKWSHQPFPTSPAGLQLVCWIWNWKLLERITDC